MTTKKKPVPKKKPTRRKAAAKKLTPQQEAKSASTSTKRLGELAEQSTALARLVARNPSANGTLLKELGSHSDATVRKWVTLHPNTPPKVLSKLATQFPEQLLDNPAFDVLLLENPNLLNELPVGTRRSLLKREKCPVSFLDWLAQDDDEGVQLALAMNPNTPAHILEALSASKSKRVIDAARRHVNHSGHGALARETLREQIDTALAEEFLTRSELKRARLLFAWLVAHGPPELGFIPSLSRWAQLQLWRALANRECVPSSACMELAKDPDRDIRHAVANKSHAPGPALELLSRDSSPSVRDAVARNERTPREVWGSLARDKSSKIRASVAFNAATPPSVLQRLAEDRSAAVHYAVAWNPSTPAATLKNFAVQGEEYAPTLACNRALPPEMLAALAKHKDKWVKRRVAENPSTPHEVLESLARRKSDPEMAQGVAMNISAPPALLRELCAHRKCQVRYLVAGNPAAPKDVLDTLSYSNDPEIRSEVARNPSAPRGILRRLAEDKRCDGRFHVALNENAPGDVLKVPADGEEDDILAVARNRSTRPAVRHSIVMKNLWVLPRLEPDLAEAAIQLVELPKQKRPSKRSEIAQRFLVENGRSNQPSFKRLLCLLLPDCPIPVLAKAGRSRDWKERLAIASHPRTPPPIRQRLANDGNELVRVSAQAALGIDTDPVRKSTRI